MRQQGPGTGLVGSWKSSGDLVWSGPARVLAKQSRSGSGPLWSLSSAGLVRVRGLVLALEHRMKQKGAPLTFQTSQDFRGVNRGGRRAGESTTNQVFLNDQTLEPS